MSKFFRPYEGRKPFVFISYSHDDSDHVLNIITPLHNQKYRVWYDEGVPAGGDWPKNIAQHMRACSAVLFFVSAAALASDNCYKEIHEAVQQKKPVLCVRFDQSALTPKWVALIGQAPVLAAGDEPVGDFARAILEQGIIDTAFLGDGTNDAPQSFKGVQFNAWTVIAAFGVLLLIVTAVFTYGFANNWLDEFQWGQETNQTVAAQTPRPTAAPTPVPTIYDDGYLTDVLKERVSFSDAQQERAVRSALDQPEGDIYQADLSNITQLHLCGNMVLQTDAGIAFDQDGNCSVNSAPVMQGSVADLKLFADMPALERLSLVCQKIESLYDLSSLTRLQELNIAGNPISTIGDLSGMASLTTLHLEHTQIRNLTALNGLSQLQTVTASAEMFPLTLDDKTQRFDIVLAH